MNAGSVIAVTVTTGDSANRPWIDCFNGAIAHVSEVPQGWNRQPSACKSSFGRTSPYDEIGRETGMIIGLRDRDDPFRSA